jgi:hypothetical protein
LAERKNRFKPLRTDSSSSMTNTNGVEEVISKFPLSAE